MFVLLIYIENINLIYNYCLYDKGERKYKEQWYLYDYVNRSNYKFENSS